MAYDFGIMRMRSSRVGIAFVVLLMSGPMLLSGCSQSSGPRFEAKEEPWRSAEERACMSSGSVRQTRYLQGRSALNGPSVCGAAAPFEMHGAMDGRVAMKPAALLRCPMIPQIDRWVSEVVEPAARVHFGQSVTELRVASSYSCRPINHKWGGKLSEHGYANAIDISGFRLANGDMITVKGGWYGSAAERNFLRAVHQGACDRFTTVLGPKADRFHHDHFHMDLARRGRNGLMRICR
jgi:hypothetical protein